MSKSHYFWIIILVLFSLNVGFFLGNQIHQKRPQMKLLRTEQNKINEALEVISKNYVDTVDMSNLAESAVRKIVSELDPHSSYIPASEAETVYEDLEISFGGIGIQFNMLTDTIIVTDVISGGPAQEAGLMRLDRIITVDDSIVAGKNISSNRMMRMLRGPKNSTVMLGIQRGAADDLIQFELTRGDIPNNTIDISYKVSDKIGYIKVTKFARSTHNEFLTAIAKLKQEGVEGFVVDLRDNPGGLMDFAYLLVNEFLPRGQLIVSSQGQAFMRAEYRANGKGVCQDVPIVVLMDEQSGSASEIFAGAVQDNDRGLIVGRRSYGKGLIQTKFDLSDNSGLLLTIARYYTPSGRCIQKEYELGKAEEYSWELNYRRMHGEYFSADSIKLNDSLAFTTVGGRTVYGGGGIMPDIFVPEDTTAYTSYLAQLSNTNVLYQFMVEYLDNNREQLSTFDDYMSLYQYLKEQPLIDKLADYAESKGIRKRPTLLAISKDWIENWLHANIVRIFYGSDGFYPIYQQDDATLNKAIEVIEKNIWRPELYLKYIESNPMDNSKSSASMTQRNVIKQLAVPA